MTRLLVAALLAAALPAAAATPPSRMMANVYLLAEAGAMIDICIASPAFKELSPSGAREVEGFDRRLAGIVRSIGDHYGEQGLDDVYAATKARIAADPRLRFHVRNNYAYCGDHLIGQLRTYVAENEAMLGDYFRGKAPKAPAR